MSLCGRGLLGYPHYTQRLEDPRPSNAIYRPREATYVDGYRVTSFFDYFFG